MADSIIATPGSRAVTLGGGSTLIAGTWIKSSPVLPPGWLDDTPTDDAQLEAVLPEDGDYEEYARALGSHVFIEGLVSCDVLVDPDGASGEGSFYVGVGIFASPENVRQAAAMVGMDPEDLLGFQDEACGNSDMDLILGVREALSARGARLAAAAQRAVEDKALQQAREEGRAEGREQARAEQLAAVMSELERLQGIERLRASEAVCEQPLH